jgi:hypothetical protein
MNSASGTLQGIDFSSNSFIINQVLRLLNAAVWIPNGYAGSS